MYCNETEALHSPYDGLEGGWTEQRSCASNKRICSLKTKVDTDNYWHTGLVTLQLDCCDARCKLSEMPPADQNGSRDSSTLFTDEVK